MMNREQNLKKLAGQAFDLLVIGGGITGAGIAREAALRGLKVALVEAGDFGSGTSSRSTKLIHGGLRYLKNFEFRLVKESVTERQRLLAMAPHLVKATPFLFPVYQGDPDGLLKLHVGLAFYDWFAGAGNPIPHTMQPPGSLVALEPSLRAEGLRGGAVYGDSRTDDARLTMAVLQSAAAHGVALVNYAAVQGFRKDGAGRITGAVVTDRLTGGEIAVQAGRVLAAAGPWADAVRQLDDPAAKPLLRLTKGIHLTVPKARLPVSHCVVIRGRDGRMMFAVPHGDYTYAGTTDTDYTGDPAAVRAEGPDVAYVLDALHRSFPSAAIGFGDVVSTWAGLRPLLRPVGIKDPSATSRDYKLFTSPSGLITVAGGKLTAFRAMAEHIVDGLFPAAGRHTGKSTAPLPGATAPGVTDAEIAGLAERTGVEVSVVSRLVDYYGGNFGSVAAAWGPGGAGLVEAGLEPGEAEPGHPAALRWTLARVRHAVNAEMATRLEDVIWRRTDLMLFTPDNSSPLLDRLAGEMAGLLGWSDSRRQAEIAICRDRIRQMHAWREEV
ncbi:MAG TPA: glycerol-3-phosphate dehydrogenase/oxidase [Symbiobacteriaceae bacterium]|jgi:glycerol-3-phosphate dehydrogenase